MARTSKAPKTSSDAPAESAPVVNTAAPPAAAAKAPKVKKAKTAEAATTPAPVVASPAPVVDAPAEGDSLEASILEQSTEFNAKLQQLTSLISALKSEYKSLEKKWQRELKTAQKQSSKRKRKSGNRAPSGFVKPTRISDELAAFLGKAPGTEMARTAVSKEINNYIRANKLQDTTNGRKINPDARLSSLLKIESADELTYFNLQRFMKHHFPKSEVANVQVSATA